MTDHIVFVLLGLGNGAVFAALGIALVVTYRSSGVVNFATGAMALFSAYFYAFLRQGRLFVPIPGLPTSVSLGGVPPVPLAMAIALVASALLGMLVYATVFRPLRNSTPLAKVVASVGLMLLLQALLAQRIGTAPVEVRNIFPAAALRFGSIRVPQDRLWFAATIAALGLALWAAYRFTRFGLNTRAVAETEKGAIVSGVDPQRVALANWAISGAVGGLSGILIAPIVPLVPVSYTLFIVPALAAALFGRFVRVGPAILGGLAIGMIQSELTYLRSQHAWLPSAGLPELVPLILILVFLGVRGRPLPSRGELIERNLGRTFAPRRRLVPALVGTAVVAMAFVVLQHDWRAGLLTSVLMALVALSWVVITGFVGQVSLAQMTLAGVGAFGLTTVATRWGVPFPLAPLLAALIATAIGVAVGLPALRIRGISFAIVTLALGVAIENLWFESVSLTGGISGPTVTGPTFLGFDLSVGVGTAYPRIGFCLLSLGVLALVASGVAWLRLSRLGGRMLAVRDNERSAAAAGISVARTKLTAFAISSFIAGLGGALLAYQQTEISPQTFSVFTGLGVLAVTFLAGITSVPGALLAGLLAAGGLVFVAISHLVDLGQWYGIVAGLMLIVATISYPDGIAGSIQARLERRHRRATAPARAPHPVVRLDTVGVTALRPGRPLDREPSDLFSVRGLTVRYGGVTAVSDVSFDLEPGRITGLIGPNGAGKTSLIDAVSGFAPASGRVVLNGASLDGMAPDRRARVGLSRTFQGAELWDDLTVLENIRVGESAAGRGRRRPDLARPSTPAPDHVADTMALLGLAALADRPIRELSQGQRKLVSVARALAGRPDVLLLDEPAAGLDSSESRWLGERLRTVLQAGVTMLLVDHDMALVLGTCDTVHVLDFGQIIASGSPSQIQADAGVTAAYLGATHSTVTEPARADPADGLGGGPSLGLVAGA